MATLAKTPLYDFINDVQRLGVTHPSFLLEIGLLALCAILAAVLTRFIKSRMLGNELQQDHWRIGTAGVRRMLYPLIFWILVYLALSFTRLGHGVGLLRLCASLLGAWALVRIVVYLVQEVFIQARWVQGFEKLIAAMLWAVFAMHILGVLPEVEAALDQFSLPLGKQRISLLMVINGVMSVVVTLILAMWLSRLFERRVMGTEAFDISSRVVISKIARTFLIFLAVVIALPVVGIDLTVLSVFGGAVGVGLGFGLQKIASNYVSGFIILLDRSTRIGDLITIDNRQGTVQSITARYVVLKLGDGAEAIIPNETLITSTVINQSYTDHRMRMVIMLNVEYGAQLDRLIALLIELAQGHERVLDDPKPQAFIRNLGDNGIEIEFAVWLDHVDLGSLDVRSDLNRGILDILKAENVLIARPRRAVQLSANSEVAAGLPL